MSALERLSGVRRLEDATIEELEADAEKLDWRCVVLDGAEVEDRESFLQMCDEAFGLPDWFGMNWDALEECLIDLDLGEDDAVWGAWSSWGLLVETEPKALGTAVDILGGAVRSWASDGVAGGVVLVGEGPDVEVDEL